MDEGSIIDMNKEQAAAFLGRLRKLKREIDNYGIASANFLNDTKIFANVCATFSKRAGRAEKGIAEGASLADRGPH